MASLIPMRPKSGKFTLLQEEMDGLSYYVLSGCSREAAFLKFVRPDFIGSKATAAVKAAVTQFFASKEAQEYMEAYKKTISELLNPKMVKSEQSGSLEERKARAKTKATEFAISLADNIEDAADPEFVLKLMDKVGLLDQEEQAEELPRRYLPVSPCQTACAYRMFCEENTEDMCQYCKYHAFGEENGVHYEKENILDVPAKFV